MNGYNDILGFLQGSQPAYGDAMNQISRLINYKMQPRTSFFGANRVPIKSNEVQSGFIDRFGNFHFGQPM